MDYVTIQIYDASKIDQHQRRYAGIFTVLQFKWHQTS